MLHGTFTNKYSLSPLELICIFSFALRNCVNVTAMLPKLMITCLYGRSKSHINNYSVRKGKKKEKNCTYLSNHKSGPIRKQCTQYLF